MISNPTFGKALEDDDFLLPSPKILPGSTIDSRVRGIGNKINTLGSSVHSYMGHMACISVFEN